MEDKSKIRKFTIELNEKQLHMIEAATELECRIRMGQMWLGPVQDVFSEAYEKSHPGKKWLDIQEELEQDMKMLQQKYFALSPNASYGLGHDDYSDTLWDIHKCCEHARYLAMSEEDREKLRWTVLADPPMQFGTEPLMTVKEDNGTGWHSVNDCLPPMDEEVIVLTNVIHGKEVPGANCICYGHIVDKRYCVDYNGWNIPGIHHWMTCPKLPKDAED